jgi:hypothetical protein
MKSIRSFGFAVILTLGARPTCWLGVRAESRAREIQLALRSELGKHRRSAGRV